MPATADGPAVCRAHSTDAELPDQQPATATTNPRRRYSVARGSLADLWNGRDNGIGAIRLGLAVAVVLAHATSLGFG